MGRSEEKYRQCSREVWTCGLRLDLACCQGCFWEQEKLVFRFWNRCRYMMSCRGANPTRICTTLTLKIEKIILVKENIMQLLLNFIPVLSPVSTSWRQWRVVYLLLPKGLIEAREFLYKIIKSTGASGALARRMQDWSSSINHISKLIPAFLNLIDVA